MRIHTGIAPEFTRLEMGDPLAAVEPLTVIEATRAWRYAATKSNCCVQRAAAGGLCRRSLCARDDLYGEVLTEDENRLPQPIEPGDASAAVSTNSLRVLGAANPAAEIVQRVRLSSGVVTPNGDGVNDRLAIEYALFLLPAPVPVVLEVYDLAGNRRAHEEVGAQGTGPQRALWDGRDEQGRTFAARLVLIGVGVGDRGPARACAPARWLGLLRKQRMAIFLWCATLSLLAGPRGRGFYL